MTKRNRKTLSDYFKDGNLPTQEAFEELIESSVNIIEDGFEKTAVDGMKVAQLGNNSKLISFYDEITAKEPLWTVSFSLSNLASGDGTDKNLNFFHATSKQGLTLAGAATPDTDERKAAENIRVGINVNSPGYALDVGGVVAADGRVGREGKKERQVSANGEWHKIIDGLDGCHAFEIMAGVGRPGSGRYALLHAFALSTFNSKKSNITYHQAYYSSKCDKIELRWSGDMHNYALEMRTRCNLNFEKNKKKVFIRYYLTKLWFDPFMEGCIGISDDDLDAPSMDGKGK